MDAQVLALKLLSDGSRLSLIEYENNAPGTRLYRLRADIDGGPTAQTAGDAGRYFTKEQFMELHGAINNYVQFENVMYALESVSSHDDVERLAKTVQPLTLLVLDMFSRKITPERPD